MITPKYPYPAWTMTNSRFVSLWKIWTKKLESDSNYSSTKMATAAQCWSGYGPELSKTPTMSSPSRTEAPPTRFSLWSVGCVEKHWSLFVLSLVFQVKSKSSTRIHAALFKNNTTWIPRSVVSDSTIFKSVKTVHKKRCKNVHYCLKVWTQGKETWDSAMNSG